ncbi:MAG TPA: putative glycoside hydrolase [Sporichthya sp.]|nr:putative glycoside hydrolase [Sporichthya sp.]
MTGTEGMPPASWGEPEGGGTVPPAAPTKRKTGRNVAIVGGVAALLLVVGAAAYPLTAGSVELAANKELGTALNADGVKDLAFTVTGAKMSDVKLKLDGNEVQGAQDGDNIVYKPADLAEGKHTFSASKSGSLGRTASSSKDFTIDSTAPVLTIDKPAEGAKIASATDPYDLKGKVEGAKELKVDDKTVEVGKDGTFSVHYDKTPATIKVWAIDDAGNVTEQTVSSNLRHAGMRAVHMTALAWAYKPLHDPVVQLLKDKKIDTIQLDIKDEDGIIGYDSNVALADQAGASKDTYKLDEAVKEIHDLGGRIVGRIVAFRDPKLAKYAIGAGKMDMVIQNKSGSAYNAGSYGAASFTNFGNADVRQYNIDLGVEAAKAGFDDIMYDYIRRPEAHAASGGLEGQVFPGLPKSDIQGVTDQELGIANFVDEAGKAIHAEGAGVGAAVFGISSFTPTSVAQNIPLMAKHLDFIDPMVYPSHWGPGEYSVAKPNNSPYDIVKRSLQDFNRQVLGTNCVIIPWLQDFSLGVSYGVAEVKAQIKATKDVGINSFIMWNATAKYTAAALEPGDYANDREGELVYSINKPGNNSDGTKDAEKAKQFIDAYYEAKKNGTTFVDPTQPGATSTGTGSPSSSGSTDSSSTPAPTSAQPSTEPTSSPTP